MKLAFGKEGTPGEHHPDTTKLSMFVNEPAKLGRQQGGDTSRLRVRHENQVSGEEGTMEPKRTCRRVVLRSVVCDIKLIPPLQLRGDDLKYGQKIIVVHWHDRVGLRHAIQSWLRFKRARFKRVAGLREVKIAWHTHHSFKPNSDCLTNPPRNPTPLHCCSPVENLSNCYVWSSTPTSIIASETHSSQLYWLQHDALQSCRQAHVG